MAESLIGGIELITFDLKRAMSFYVHGLGFTEIGTVADGEDLLGLLTLHKTVLRLRAPGVPGASYPQPMAANDPWFQHFAIAVSDPRAACDRVSSVGGIPVSYGGPVELPASSGSVTAWKFRDPDGHPLELSAYPDERKRVSSGDPLFLRVDHTAVAVSDLDRSTDFYLNLGFRESGRGLNQGQTQARLDGLADPIVEIVVLEGNAQPHLELLRYRQPEPPSDLTIAGTDVAATRTLIRGLFGTVLDPDGHRLSRLSWGL